MTRLRLNQVRDLNGNRRALANRSRFLVVYLDAKRPDISDDDVTLSNFDGRYSFVVEVVEKLNDDLLTSRHYCAEQYPQTNGFPTLLFTSTTNGRQRDGSANNSRHHGALFRRFALLFYFTFSYNDGRFAILLLPAEWRFGRFWIGGFFCFTGGII